MTKPWEVFSPHLDMSLDIPTAKPTQLYKAFSLFWFKKPSRGNFTKQFFVSIFDLVSLWKSYNFANAALTELIKQIAPSYYEPSQL